MKRIKSHRCFGGEQSFWEHSSTSTQTVMKFSTFQPAGVARGALIWLSGLTCTDENFPTKAGAQRALAEAGLMVICPDTSPRGLQLPGEHESWDFGAGAGFYVNAKTQAYRDHYRMEDYINLEIYGILEREFGLSGRISLFGHSMGGHGALTLGLKYPERYRSLSAFAPITHPVACPWGQKAFAGYLGSDRELWDLHDACRLVQKGKRHPKPILIDQGTEDSFLKEGQLQPDEFRKVCEAGGQELTLRYQQAYDHSYYFIASFIEDHIAFHAKVLAETGRP